MVDDLNAQKAALRLLIRERLKGISPEQRESASRALCLRLMAQSMWGTARAILFFAPIADEPDTWPLLGQALAEGKIVCLPRYVLATQSYVAAQVRDLPREINSGNYGIREPVEACPQVPWAELGLVIVPGVAFDATGRRLGRGRGFYDRLLLEVSALRCGVALDEQVVSEVPVGKLDERVNYVVTPTRILET